jgi:hypothetical protein
LKFNLEVQVALGFKLPRRGLLKIDDEAAATRPPRQGAGRQKGSNFAIRNCELEGTLAFRPFR